jgi:hypothetical protein
VKRQGFVGFYWSVFEYWRTDTFRFIREHALIEAAFGVGGPALLALLLGTPNSLKTWLAVFSPLMGICLVVVMVALLNAVASPARVYEDLRLKILDLNSMAGNPEVKLIIERLEQKTYDFNGQEFSAAAALQRIGHKLALGLHLSWGYSAVYELMEIRHTNENSKELHEAMDDLFSIFWLEKLLRKERRQPSTSGRFSAFNHPYDVLYLTDLGADVVRELERPI